jgi:hypothetical protein
MGAVGVTRIKSRGERLMTISRRGTPAELAVFVVASASKARGERAAFRRAKATIFHSGGFLVGGGESVQKCVELAPSQSARLLAGLAAEPIPAALESAKLRAE